MKTKNYLKNRLTFGLELKNETKTKNGGKENNYEKDYMKIKFDS